MKNFKPLMKRVCAYTIDMFIVLIVSSLISSIPVLNKNSGEYQDIYKEYELKFNDYSEYLQLIESSYEDEEISEEEYHKLTESETYQEIITSKYDDQKLSKGEYNEIVEEINKEFDLIAKDYIYLLAKSGVLNSIITLACTLIYFGIIQYFLKGQTVGKKLLKLKVVSASKKSINILNYLLRSLVVNDVLLNAIGVVFLLLTSKTVYTRADNIISTLISVVEAVIIFLVLTREDQRGLHDILFNTQVISTEGQETKTKSKKSQKVIEANYKEES